MTTSTLRRPERRPPSTTDRTGQRVISKQLAHIGVQADFANNGVEALELWLAHRQYSLVLTDLHMPEMDGYELTRCIRGEETGNEHIPIIALTANAVTGETFEAYKAGDLRASKVLAHRLKSSSRSVGALRLGDIFAEVETMQEVASGEDIDLLSAEIQHSFMRFQRRCRERTRQTRKLSTI